MRAALDRSSPPGPRAKYCSTWGAQATVRQSREGSRDEHASERRSCRTRSCACLDLATNCVENRLDLNFQHGGIDLYGPLRDGSVGPNSATDGVPRATAKCSGPVSPPTMQTALRSRAMSWPSEPL